MFRIISGPAKLSFLFLILTFLSGCAVLTPKAKPDYTVEIADMDFVFVKGGTYQRGSNDHRDEQPVRSVTIQDLFVSMYEVTFDQYDQYCVATNCEPPSDSGFGRKDRPVINVSWNDANAYAKWLSEQTGQSFRLPSESEWEYFARAGTTTAYWTGESLPKGSANCSNCGSQWDNKMTAPVGSFDHNPWKIYETAGNVAEWTADDFVRGYSDAPTDGTAVIRKDSTRKVQRGGAWDYKTHELRSSNRDYRRAQSHKNDTGFRLVLIPTAELLPPTTVKK